MIPVAGLFVNLSNHEITVLALWKKPDPLHGSIVRDQSILGTRLDARFVQDDVVDERDCVQRHHVHSHFEG